jgi:hypothetical protein
MTTPEPAAYESLERRLDEVLGPQDAGTLRTVLSSLATKEDLGLLRLEVRDLRTSLDHQNELLHVEMASLRHEIIGALEGKINAAITSQTKPLLIGIVSVAVVVAAAVLSAARFA